MSAFDRLHRSVQYHVVNSLGWPSLRPVQELATEPALAGENLVVLAPTAGGKTEAAFFPLISEMLTCGWKGLSVLYLSPVKALLNNQEPRLIRYFGLVGRRVAVWHGDTARPARRRIIADQPDCLLTTPESVEGMLVSAAVPHADLFANLRAVVVDEAHAFAGDDRGWHLLAVLQRLQRLAGRDLQRVGLSATVGNPDDVLAWLASGSTRPGRVVRPPDPGGGSPPDVQVDYVGSLANAARVVAALHGGEKRLVFCDSRSRVEQLAAHLRADGVATFVTHSSLSLDERRQAERAFSAGRNCVIVATSTLELGVDVGDLDRVVQVDAPRTVSSFLQRMGRTGRRLEAVRNCLFLATSDDALLRAAALVRLWATGHVEPAVGPPLPLHVLAQQVMALALQERGIPRNDWQNWIGAVPAFASLTPGLADTVVDGLLGRDVLWDDAGVLWLGRKGQDRYGRRYFRDLCAVFTAAPEFTVLHGREHLGSVAEATFLARPDGGPVVLLLAGRSWRVTAVDWPRRRAFVEPAGGSGRSVWRGEGQFLGRPLCRAVQEVLAADDEPPAWTRRAQEQMSACRAAYSWIDASGTQVVAEASGRVGWWTFGGGRANAALATAIGQSLDVSASSDNFAVHFPDSVLPTAAYETVQDLRQAGPTGVRITIDPKATAGLKFAECLGPDLAESVIRARAEDSTAVVEVLAAPVRMVFAQ